VLFWLWKRPNLTKFTGAAVQNVLVEVMVKGRRSIHYQHSTSGTADGEMALALPGATARSVTLSRQDPPQDLAADQDEAE
jgi:hypothetical protein